VSVGSLCLLASNVMNKPEVPRHAPEVAADRNDSFPLQDVLLCRFFFNGTIFVVGTVIKSFVSNSIEKDK
jgi:hypothetical protein